LSAGGQEQAKSENEPKTKGGHDERVHPGPGGGVTAA
jgi:hypothetical protein